MKNDGDTATITAGNAIQTNTIELEPFIHQVGGRSTILVFGKYICKPINDRELAFYESLDKYAPALKPFVPQYNGIISVNFEESPDGYLMITTKRSISRNNNFNNEDSTEKCSSPENDFDQSDSSPYQKFITKYRVKLVRPIKEIIIESHESDVDNPDQDHVPYDSQSSSRRYILEDNNKESNKLVDSPSNGHLHNNNNSSTSSTNLSRSRSTSISIPNFEDGNCNQSDLSSLFDNQLFMSEAGPNGGYKEKRKISTPDRINLSLQQQQQQPVMPNITHLSTTKHNPWVLKTFSVLSEFNESMKEQKFILLENLTSNFEYPCIMDLKMGTRLHDDMASQTKIQSHESKVNETTSRALGLRVTGIQIYDKDLDKFICYNKYYGRKLTPETFRSTLKMFISNENFVRHKLLPRMIERLKKLRSVIIELESFRFYTSSLLLIYEGRDCCQCNKDCKEECQQHCSTSNQDPERMFDVRVIDFAHSTHVHMDPKLVDGSAPLAHKGYDDGFVYGLDNLIKILSLFDEDK